MTDQPVPNRALPDRIRQNRLTHQWGTLDGTDYACYVCDCKMWHEAANYPCGQEPPRTSDKPRLLPLGKVPFETDGTGITEPEYGLDEPDPNHDWGRLP